MTFVTWHPFCLSSYITRFNLKNHQINSIACLFPTCVCFQQSRYDLIRCRSSLKPTDFPLFPSQYLRLSTSLSVSERRPPKPTLCLLQREKSLLINLLQTAWRKWPGGCKLSLGEKDGWRAKQRGMDGLSVREKRGWRKREEKRSRKEIKIHGNGERREEGKRKEREERGCVCVVWCKPWVLVDGWI